MQRPAAAARHRLVRRGRPARRRHGTEPLAVPAVEEQLRAAAGDGVGRQRRRQVRGPRRPRAVLSPRASQPRPERRQQPAVHPHINGLRTLDSNADPCGCFGAPAAGPNSGREQRAATPHNWQWNLSYQREILPHTTWDIGYVANKGYDLLRTPGDQRRGAGRSQSQRSRRSTRLHAVAGRRRRRRHPAVRRLGRSPDHDVEPRRRIDLSLDADAGRQPLERVASPGVLHALAQRGERRARQQLRQPVGRRVGHRRERSLRDFGLANTDRRHVFNAALVLAGPPMDDQAGWKRLDARRLGTRRDHAGRVGPGGQHLHRQHARVSTAVRPGPATPTTSGPMPPVPIAAPTTAIGPSRSSIPRL